MYKFLIFLLLFINVSCINDQCDIKLIKAEGWTDLMPVSSGLTHLLIKLEFNAGTEDSIVITGFRVKEGDNSYNLNKEDYEILPPAESEQKQAEIKAVLKLKDKDIQSVGAVISFKSGSSECKFAVDKIEIEKVY